MKNQILLLILVTKLLFPFTVQSQHSERPNILWITCEDISPYLGSYGCKEAQTPNLDNLASKGIRYTNAFTNAPVCAVSRSTILSGMYASTIGTHQMRSRVQLPEMIPAYPKILREAGYYCTNNSKKDYNSNFEHNTTIWNESSAKAHYKNRKAGQPFFAVFNIGTTHESQLSDTVIKNYVNNKQIPVKPRINPAEIKLPPYHPDLPEIREDWARLHDLITLMDQQVGAFLRELKNEGLDDNTIVFFYADHGGQLSRSKRFIYNVGTQIPLIVYLPEKWRHLSINTPGTANTEIVSGVDFAKTVASIAGAKVPEIMQGRVFLGKEKEKAPKYVHFYRDRMADRIDFSRAVNDGAYYFIRNFMPHRPRGRDNRYGNTVQANWRAWEAYYDAGKANKIQSQFYEPKPVIELFNTIEDPWQVKNIAEIKKEKVKELSDELDRWMIETRDVGLIQESLIYDLIGTNKKYKTIYEYAQSDAYPIRKILNAAKNAATGSANKISEYKAYLNDRNPIIRFWGTYALFLTRSKEKDIQMKLKQMTLNDSFATNRIMAAQALGVSGNPDFAFDQLMKECKEAKNGYILLLGLNALQYAHLDDRLTKDDWLTFQNKKFSGANQIDNYGAAYYNRIIKDALELWPKRRKVD